MSITKKQGVGGNSRIRQLSKLGEKIINRKPLDPDSRNGRRIMNKLRAKYGDDVINQEIERLNRK